MAGASRRTTNKGVAPTAALFALANLARGVLHNLDEIGAQMADYASGLRGQVRIAANLSAITQFLPGEIKRFLELHPGVEVHLEEMISTQVTKAVAENRADVGVFAPVPFGDGVETFAYPRRPARADRAARTCGFATHAADPIMILELLRGIACPASRRCSSCWEIRSERLSPRR